MLSIKDIEPYLMARRPELVRFAFMQLRDHGKAEDAVQEALMAALQNLDRFQHRSEVKTWLFCILKNKIVDQIRQGGRELALQDIAADAEDEHELMDKLFKQNGMWRRDARPSHWVEPDDSLQNQQFWRIFEACMTHLPERNARVFMMREILELDTREICETLAISDSNCWVILHRARLGLRNCLEVRWFGGEV